MRRQGPTCRRLGNMSCTCVLYVKLGIGANIGLSWTIQHIFTHKSCAGPTTYYAPGPRDVGLSRAVSSTTTPSEIYHPPDKRQSCSDGHFIIDNLAIVLWCCLALLDPLYSRSASCWRYSLANSNKLRHLFRESFIPAQACILLIAHPTPSQTPWWWASSLVFGVMEFPVKSLIRLQVEFKYSVGGCF